MKIRVHRAIIIEKSMCYFKEEIVDEKDILKIEKSNDDYMNSGEHIITFKNGNQWCVDF